MRSRAAGQNARQCCNMRPAWTGGTRKPLPGRPGPIRQLGVDPGREQALTTLPPTGIDPWSAQRRVSPSAAGELVFHVFGAIVRVGRRLVAERTRDGIVTAMKRDKRPGRSQFFVNKGLSKRY